MFWKEVCAKGRDLGLISKQEAKNHLGDSEVTENEAGEVSTSHQVLPDHSFTTPILVRLNMNSLQTCYEFRPFLGFYFLS